MPPKAKDKSKPSAAGASSPAVAIEDLFTALNRHIERSEFDQAIKVSDQGVSYINFAPWIYLFIFFALFVLKILLF